MRARDLSDEHIGQSFLIQRTDGGLDRGRVIFEGRLPPLEMGPTAAESTCWVILKVSPDSSGAMHFRGSGGAMFTGLVVRATALVIPLEVDLAVDSDGNIVETSVRTAAES